MANPFDFQNRYGGYAATGYGSNPALTAARTAAFREQEAEQIRRSLRQKEAERLAKDEAKREKEEFENKELEKAGTPAKYRDSRGTPFDKYTIAKIKAGLYSTEPPPRPRNFQGLNKFDDPEEWSKRSAEASESAGLYSEKGRMATRAMRDRVKEQKRRAALAGAGQPYQGGMRNI